jgi:hypothetical protein
LTRFTCSASETAVRETALQCAITPGEHPASINIFSSSIEEA